MVASAPEALRVLALATLSLTFLSCIKTVEETNRPCPCAADWSCCVTANVCVPDAYASYFPDYGNVASASLPLSMELARRRGALQRGHLAVFICPAAGVQAGAMVFRY